MGQQAIRKPKFLENVDASDNVLPLAFGMTKSEQNNLGVVHDLALDDAGAGTAPLTFKDQSSPAPTAAPAANEHTGAEAVTVVQDDSPEVQEEPSFADHEAKDFEESSPTEVTEAAMPATVVEEEDLKLEAATLTHEQVFPPQAAGIDANIATEKMIRTVEQLRQANVRLAEEARSTALEIGFQVAQRILEREVAADVTAMIALVRSALRKVGDAKVLRLSLHPSDHESISKALEDGQFTEIALAQLELVPNASLERGDVVVDTDFGQIDGRIKTRLKEIRTVIDDSQEGEPN